MKKATVFLIIPLLFLASCGAFSTDWAGASGSGAGNIPVPGIGAGSAGEEEYDFSVFFGHAEDPITVSRIVGRYKTETGVSIEPIMTDAGAADDRFLQRYMSASNPPAAFALSADADGSVDYAMDGGYVDPSASDMSAADFSPSFQDNDNADTYSGAGNASDNASAYSAVSNAADDAGVYSAMGNTASNAASAAGIGWRFRGIGLAADRRVLADLIGAPDAAAPLVDSFIEDICLSDYKEWSAFTEGLAGYISGTTYAAVTLNGKPYSFAGTKGRYSSLLNGVFAVSGADPSFITGRLIDLSAATSNARLLTQSRMLTTPQAFTVMSPVFDTYLSALNMYTSHIGGLYAPGIRGDDFTDEDIYDTGYVRSVFSSCRAVFMPLDSAEYEMEEDKDATQAAQIVMLPVKLPYTENWLSGYRGTIAANEAIQISTAYSLCVNASASPDVKAQAKSFVEWLAADAESSDAMQLCLMDYHVKGAGLPLRTGEEQEESDGIAAFGEEIYDDPLRLMLSDPDWQPDEISALKDSLNAVWRPAV
jgi:hypothetical protein